MLKEAGYCLQDVASIRIKEDCVSNCTAIIEKEYMKEAMVQFKILQDNMERLESRLQCRV